MYLLWIRYAAKFIIDFQSVKCTTGISNFVLPDVSFYTVKNCQGNTSNMNSSIEWILRLTIVDKMSK